MKTQFRALAAMCGAGVAATIFAAQANAGCVDVPRPALVHSAWQVQPSGLAPARLMRTAYIEAADRTPDNAAIVGMWKFSFVAEGNPPPGPPDGTVLDTGYALWHSDGTEFTNSGGRPPPSSNVCMGVWKQTGRSTFKLNHFGLSWTNDGTAFIGPANIRSEVTVDRSGNKYAGTFTIDQFDTTGTTVIVHLAGTVTATRVTVD